MDPLKHFKNHPLSEKILAYIIVNYRWIFVLIFLLPLSVIYNVFSRMRSVIAFHWNSAPSKHDHRVRNIQKQIRNWCDSGSQKKLCTARPSWQTMSFRRGIYKSYNHNISINLIDILYVDEENRFVRVEPLVSMGQLSAALLPLGWTVPVMPELDDLTVGGLLMGTGIETSSHKYGLYQHICIGLEMVLSNGELVRCSPSENEDMFYAAFWSYGTLGFLTCADIKIIPAKKFVEVIYYPCYSLDTLVDKFQTETMKTSKNEFVEAIVFSLNSGVVMTGNMSDEPPDKSQINSIGKYSKPWFFKHVESVMNNGNTNLTEYIPIRDYYHRHSRSIFWELQDIIPFGNNPIFRYTLGWAVPPKISLLKLTQGKVVKRMYEVSHLIQDMLVPLRCLQEALNLFDKEAQIYPLWLCPFVLPKLPGMLKPSFDNPTSTNNKTFQHINTTNDYVMYVDIGAYGVPKAPSYETVRSTRNLEAFVRDSGGFQMLYADTYMTREEFRIMFDHSLYDKVKAKLKCEHAFPDVYDKISKAART